MNSLIGKPFPIRVDFLQYQHIAIVVTFSDPAEIAFAVGKPNEMVFPKGELLSLNGLEHRDGIIRVLRTH